MEWPYNETDAYVPAYQWYSPSRKDNFLTAKDDWAGFPGDTRSPDYGFFRVEGYLLNPDKPQPPGTAGLYSWYSRGRGDNFATTDPVWVGEPGDRRSPDYGMYRLQGYLYEQPIAGGVALNSWYCRDRGDNFTTTHPRWMGEVGDTRSSPDYRLFRREGYLLAPEVAQVPETLSEFGAAETIGGIRPLVVVLVNFIDYKLSTPTSTYAELFGLEPGHLNTVGRMFESCSNRAFTWHTVSLVGPVEVSMTAATANGNTAALDVEVVRLAAEVGVDFSTFDSDGDGIVGNDDVGLLWVDATYPGVRGGAQTRSLREVDLGSVRVRGGVSSCDEFGGINVFAHELFHQIGFSQHIYGPGAAVNWRASFFAGSPAAPDHRPIQLDPWHKSQAGWLNGRVHRIAHGVAGSSYLLAAPHFAPDPECLIFYDPTRSTDE